MPATPRFDGVDVLRGISILAVVLLHCNIRYLIVGHPLANVVQADVLRLLFWNGGNGVTVFFAISGFLITYTSLHRFGGLQHAKPTVFYRIRFARIAPLLLAILLVLSALHLLKLEWFHISPSRATLPRALFAALTFHLNWLEAKRGYLPPNWDVMWSLSIEEMFYVFFPLLCVAITRVRRHGTVLLCMLLTMFVVLAPFGRTMWAATELEAEKSYLGGFGSIAMGCLAALLLSRWETRSMPSQKVLLALAWTGAAVMFVAYHPFHSAALNPVLRWIAIRDLDDTLLTLGTCMTTLGLVARGRSGSRWTAPLRWYGRLSYEVYLLHEFFVLGFVRLALYIAGSTGHGLGRGLIAWSALTVICSGAAGWLVARWFSEPMNRWLRGALYLARR